MAKAKKAAKAEKQAAKAEKQEAHAAKKAAKAESKSSGQTINSGGTVIESKVIKGEKTKLTSHEQGQLARGEIDEKGDATGKEPERKPGDTKVVSVKETLYQGTISAEATAAATGEPVSVRFEQMEPTTEDGLFYHFQQYHPSAIRSSFEIDTDNKIDPTKRTHLEGP